MSWKILAPLFPGDGRLRDGIVYLARVYLSVLEDMGIKSGPPLGPGDSQ